MGVVVLTLRGMECAKVVVGEMWIRRVLEGVAGVGGMMGKVDAGVEEEAGRRVEVVGGIISVVGTVDV